MQIPSLQHVTKRVLCMKYFNRTEGGNYGTQKNLPLRKGITEDKRE